jgi:hypothetical protein
MTASMSRTSISTPARVGFLEVDERADVRHAEGAEELLTPRRGEPVILVLHVVVAEYGGHFASY